MSAQAQVDPEVMLMELARDCNQEPLSFAKAFWPETKPRTWQAEILTYIGNWIKDPATHYQPCLIAIAAGHDIGKSALMAMVDFWAMSTCSGCKVVVTAGSGKQLQTKTAPEHSKWFKKSIGAHWFDVRAESIKCLETDDPNNWRLDFITWSAENTEPFQGLHNVGKRIVVIFDEASAIDESVWEATEGSLIDEGTEIIWLAFGNPTRNTGRFRECFGKFKHRWKTFQIDSRTVEGTNKQQIEKWIEDYGEDSDFVRVRVRGEFPRAGAAQFISSELVAMARKYKAAGFEALPKVLSVDVARFGDDQTIIGMRQGRKFQILGKYRGKDTVWVANETIRFIQERRPDATVIDADGLGAGVVDNINHRGFGHRLFEFHGGAPANDAAAFYNRRAEVWGSTRDWLMAGAEIPDDAELADHLTQPEYSFSNKQQIQLEKKEDMKARGLDSPDCGDCLAMTFAVKVMPKPKPLPQQSWGSDMSGSWMA